MHEMRDTVPLGPLGITDLHLRWSLAGNVLVKIPGEGRGEKIASLAEQLKGALAEKEVAVSRPVRCRNCVCKGWMIQ